MIQNTYFTNCTLVKLKHSVVLLNDTICAFHELNFNQTDTHLGLLKYCIFMNCRLGTNQKIQIGTFLVFEILKIMDHTKQYFLY
jgi:hypothetical protein